MQNKRIFKTFLKFVNNKDRKVLKQKFHDYLHEIAIENIEKIIELRRAKLIFKKEITVLLLYHLCI